jgi:methionine biosynthesis protein MetW
VNFLTRSITKSIIKKEFKVIAQIIQNNKRVLDVGCGDGTLMQQLIFSQQNDVRGLETQKKLVQKCIAKGLSVIEGDAEKELIQFPNKSFDYVVLSQTLQAFLLPEEVLKQLLRIGKQTIVSIPNFGYWKVRLHLLFKGTMPITKNLPHEWYNTPNLHMCTIQDFTNFSKKKNIKIDKSLCLTNEKISEITNNNMIYKNIFSQLGIFLIQ